MIYIIPSEAEEKVSPPQYFFSLMVGYVIYTKKCLSEDMEGEKHVLIGELSEHDGEDDVWVKCPIDTGLSPTNISDTGTSIVVRGVVDDGHGSKMDVEMLSNVTIPEILHDPTGYAGAVVEIDGVYMG